jgi:glucoamylase
MKLLYYHLTYEKFNNKRALVWKVVTTGANGKWRTTKKFFSDPSRNSVIERVLFETLEPGKTVSDYDVYLLNNPAINNSGGGQDAGTNDNSRTLTVGGRTFLAASEPGSLSSVVGTSLPWKQTAGQPAVSHGFVGTNDGFTDLFGGANDKRMDWHFSGAFGGNVAQMGWIDFGANAGTGIAFDIVLAFGPDEAAAANEANATLSADLDALEQTYTRQWELYTGGLSNLNGTADDQYYLECLTKPF